MSGFENIWSRLLARKLEDEEQAVARLLAAVPLSPAERQAIGQDAAAIVREARSRRDKRGTLDAFLEEFGLGTDEGVALMCLAEALLRIPDAATADMLIAEKITGADWAAHVGQADSLFVNASTLGLMMTGRVIELDKATLGDPFGWLSKLVNRLGEPVIRTALKTGMRALGGEFVTGRTIEEALGVAAKQAKPGLTHSYDMLGEGARSEAQATHHLDAYRHAIDAVGRAAGGVEARAGTGRRPSVSVKLSALDPRYEIRQRARVMTHVLPRLRALCLQARQAGVALTIDAEEADRLTLSLELLESLARDPALVGWNGLGLAIQAYQKRVVDVIAFVAALAQDTGRTIPARLVKGAYWDGEIKAAQVKGLSDFPVYTRKAATDVSYLVAAKAMLDAGSALAPQFATHNAQTLATIMAMAQGRGDIEFQRLHGMGGLLYEAAEAHYQRVIPVRVYAPVGGHEDLLPYLVRRLLENGANSSFVAGFLRDDVAIEHVIADPVERLVTADPPRHPKIPAPPRLYGHSRMNSVGVDLAHEPSLQHLTEVLERPWPAGQGALAITSPADRNMVVGRIEPADDAAIEHAFQEAERAQAGFDALGAGARAAILERAADVMEAEFDHLFRLLVAEAGKTWADAVGEIREAVDFLRYYAGEARRLFAKPEILPGPVGETNTLRLAGRGIFVCISPWNFPLAIFTGQVAAALAAGNSVLAKPADQTPLIARYAVDVLNRAGLPAGVLHLLPGSGREVGAKLTRDERVAGVAFTGSTATAKTINRTLAEREGPIATLIAETGGQNAFVVDSTALLEQVVDDVVASAFHSAGQRCSAARVLCVQDDVSEALITLLKGAMAVLKVGDPALAVSDVGPIIDAAALSRLQAHLDHLPPGCRILAQAPLGESCARGTYLAPTLVEIDALSRLKGEVFGPILHVLRYKADGFDALLSEIAKLGFGLTFGLHSRLEARATHVGAIMPVGNIYINRSTIGAVVGTQPFGGQGLSGTGPKAGGPHYLPRFATERSLTINTAAQGGNATLLLLDEGA